MDNIEITDCFNFLIKYFKEIPISPFPKCWALTTCTSKFSVIIRLVFISNCELFIHRWGYRLYHFFLQTQWEYNPFLLWIKWLEYCVSNYSALHTLMMRLRFVPCSYKLAPSNVLKGIHLGFTSCKSEKIRG